NDDGANNWNNDDNDDAGGNGNNANGDDANNNADGDDANGNGGGDAVQAEQAAYANADDDVFHWNSNVGFDGVSVMPISCINYNGGQMIKFQLFDSENSYQCHFSEIATFVVSIAHYMRGYFNYQALVNGKDFELPADAGYLNCVMLQETIQNDSPLYAKIGCVDRETFTSTKLQLHLYLNKANGNWYDDYYISQNGQKNGGNNDDDGNDAYQQANDDVNRDDDWYYYHYDGQNYNAFVNDDDYYSAKDDDSNNNVNQYYYQYDGNDGYYNDDGGGRRMRHRMLELAEKEAPLASVEAAAPGQLEAYNAEFWGEYNELQASRSLYENNYDVGDWNMCQRIYKYGVWCDEECRALDFFRTDQWSASDIFLLSIMCTFVTAMMLLVVAKRLKAQQKAKIYGEEQPMPGLPPLAMALIFFVIMFVVVALAKLRFVNETLVFAVVTCILLFIYVLRLTLFESPRPVLLAAPSYFERYDEKNFGQASY
ncbi:expressed unknown protein (Partial), partial [Seminavis robusta]